MLVIIGVQASTFGVFAKIIAIRERLLPPDPKMDRLLVLFLIGGRTRNRRILDSCRARILHSRCPDVDLIAFWTIKCVGRIAIGGTGRSFVCNRGTRSILQLSAQHLWHPSALERALDLTQPKLLRRLLTQVNEN